MEKAKLDEILANHKKWLEGNGGERADLRYADLSEADLREAALSNADLRGADLSEANLRNADLSFAALSNADLRGADLSGADFDYSCFPLWYGGTDFKCDERLVLQLLAQVSTLHFETENIELLEALKLVRKVSRLSHRASDFGLT
jgi:hypothetical protein